MQKKFLIILIFFAISVTYAKGVSDDIKYLDSASIYKQDIEKYKGVQYLFHSFIKYDNEAYPPPFPYKDGRVRDGKYKASETALDAYIKGLSKYNNKSFTLAHVDYSANNVKGIVMACENGDSLYVGISTIRQFINKEYFDGIKKLKGTKTIYQVPHSNYLAIFEGKCPQNNCTDEEILFPKQYPYFVGFTDVKTKKTSFYLPYLSTWKIEDVVFDTTFVGEQTSFSNRANLFFNRIRLTIKNEKYGKYYYFEDNLLNIVKRNETIDVSNDCKEPIRDEDGRWEQKCSNYHRYWWDPVVFSQTLRTVFKDCPALIPPYESYCIDTAAFQFNNLKLFDIKTVRYEEDEIKLINEWASKGFLEAIWTKGLSNIESNYIDEDKFKKLIREGCIPAAAFAIYNFFNKDIELVSWQEIFDGMKNAYKIYGKQFVLDIMLDQLFKQIQMYPSAEKDKFDILNKKVSESRYDSAFTKLYKKNEIASYGYSDTLNIITLEQLFEESQIFSSIKLDELYKKAVIIGYDSAQANRNISEYKKLEKEYETEKKEKSTQESFLDSLINEKYLFTTTFEQNLKRIQKFSKRHNKSIENFNNIVHTIIGLRTLPLWEQAKKTSNPKDSLIAYETQLKLFTQAVSYGHYYRETSGFYKFERRFLRNNITKIRSRIKIDSELEQKTIVPENIFKDIQQTAQKEAKEEVEQRIKDEYDKFEEYYKNAGIEINKVHDELYRDCGELCDSNKVYDGMCSEMNEVYEKAISKILDKQKKIHKDSLTEINQLEQEIELYQLATKYGYKNGQDSLSSKQKKLNHLRNVELYYKNGK